MLNVYSPWVLMFLPDEEVAIVNMVFPVAVGITVVEGRDVDVVA
jgi:hypothetical protein